MASNLEPYGVTSGGDFTFGDVLGQGVEQGFSGIAAENTQAPGVLGPLSSNDNNPFLVAEENGRKLLTRKLLLMVEMKKFHAHLRCAKSHETDNVVSKFNEIRMTYEGFKSDVDTIMDSEVVTDLLYDIADQYENCHCRLADVTRKYGDDPGENDTDNVDPSSDSVSHADFYSTTSSKMSTASRKIELKRKRLEVQAKRDLKLAMAEDAAVKAEAAAVRAEVETRFMIEQANLNIEEELLLLSGHGSSVADSRRSKRNEPLTSLKFVPSKNKPAQKGSLAEAVEPASILSRNVPKASGAMKGVSGSGSKWHISSQVERDMKLNPDVGPFLPSKFCNAGESVQPSRLGVNELAQPCASFSKLDSRRGDRGVNYITPLNSGFPVQTRRHTAASLHAANDESIFKTYLERQGRNEYLNLASQIGYNEVILLTFLKRTKYVNS